MSPKTKFLEGEKVLCFHGPLIYEAKCLKVQLKDKQVKFYIHYAGWNKNWDEWVPESRVLKLNDANLQRQKDLQKAHETALKGKKIIKKIVEKKKGKEVNKESGGTSSSGGGDDSRSSTPSTDRSTSSKRSVVQAVTNSTKPIDGDDSKKKRSRSESNVETEDQFVSSVEIRIKLPDELKPILVDDWDLINRQRKLPVIPARASVDTILQDFAKSRTSFKNNTPNRESAVQEVVAGLREYFNVMIGTQLLYKFERLQYADVLKENSDRQMSDIYGFLHLTRLFVRLGQMLAYTQLDDKSVNLLNFHLLDFLRFMVKNMDTYYSIQDYGIASPEYQRKAV